MKPVFPVVIALTLVLVLAACGTGVSQEELDAIEQRLQQIEADNAALTQQLAELREQPEKTAVATAIGYIDGAGFHAMDESLHSGEINPRYLGTVRNVLAVSESTSWPEALHEQADAFNAAARRLAEVLEAQDVAAAADAAAAAHDAQHTLSHAAFGWLAGESGGHGHDVGQGNGQPANGEQGAIPEGAVRFSIDLRENGSPVAGEATHTARKGDVVAFVVQSAVDGQFHVHGYNREWPLEAGHTAAGWFEANATGRFPLEVHLPGEEGVPAGYLEVHP